MIKIILQHGLQAFETAEVNNPISPVQVVGRKFKTESQGVSMEEAAVGMGTPLAERNAETQVMPIGLG